MTSSPRISIECTSHIKSPCFSEGDVNKGEYADTFWGNVREKFASMGLLPLEFTDCLQDSPYFRLTSSPIIPSIIIQDNFWKTIHRTPSQVHTHLVENFSFRDSLHSHEKELERTSQNIKELIKEVKNLVGAAKNLSRAQRSLSDHLVNFKFDCIGSNQVNIQLTQKHVLQSVLADMYLSDWRWTGDRWEPKGNGETDIVSDTSSGIR